MKIIKYLTLIILILGFNNVVAYNFDNTSKVYDYALDLTDKQVDKLRTSVLDYIDKNNIDMVLVTVKHYNYSSIEEYSKEFYKKNNFGLGSDKSGIIMVVDLNNNDVIIKTFGEATKLYDKVEINNMRKNIKQKMGSYDRFKRFIRYSNRYIKEDNNITNNYDILYSINWPILLIVSSILPTILTIIIVLKIRTENIKKSNNTYSINYDVVVHRRIEKFITTKTKQINKNN